MSDRTATIEYGSATIAYSVTRRDRRTLEISVLPNMSVEVTAPKSAKDEVIHQRVRRRARWILKQIDYFKQFMPRTPARRFVPGETYLHLGRRYRLKFIRSDETCVMLTRDRLVVRSPVVGDPEAIRKLLNDWQSKQARVCFERRLAICMKRFGEREIAPPKALIVRRLKSRWGSLSAAGRLVLNTSLVQAAVQEIDYVIAHELGHKVHYNHSPRFFELLSRIMPDWQARKARLERRLASM